MKTAISFPCPFCGKKLIPSETRDGSMKFICASKDCMAVIEFSPIMFGQPVSHEDAFERIQKRAG